MKDCINIGLLGVGTVGSGVLHVLEHNGGEIAKKAGCKIEIKKILVRNPQKAAELGKKYAVTGDFEDIVNDPDIDIVVELIGREHPAKEYIASALEQGKNVVTANKDVLAKYGRELFPLAELHNVDFMFEGAVGGGIPIIRPLKSCLAANRIKSVMGIVNGTTNYMLTKMSQDHMDYGEVLREAQEKGYAESDPTADVGGLDAARKLVILASIAFNTRISLDDVLVSGIESLKLCDIEYAKELGYTIKLLAVAKHDEEKGITVCVRPTMLPTEHPLAGVNDVFNAVLMQGDMLGDVVFYGKGAGKLPTASAVVADVIDALKDGSKIHDSLFWKPAEKLDHQLMDTAKYSYYIRTAGVPAAGLANVAGPGKLVVDYGDSAAYLIEAATAADLEAVAAKLEVLGGRLALVLKKLPE